MNKIILLLVISVFILVVQPYTLNIGKTLALLLLFYFPIMNGFYLVRIFKGWGMNTDLNIWVNNIRWIRPEKATKKDKLQAKINFFSILLISSIFFALIFYFHLI